MVMSASAPLQMLAPKPYRSNESSTLASRGLVSEPQFFWSAGSFVFGLGVHIYVYTIHYALVLWWTHSPRWVFLALAGVAGTQLGNVLIMNLTTDAPDEPMIQFLITLTDWVLEWSGFCGFAWLNWYRFRAMCRESRPWLVHFISLLLFLQVGLWTGVAVTRCVAMWAPRDWEIVTKRLAYISSAFILDAIANVFTSLAFIYHLRSLHPSPARGNGLISTWRARSRTLSTMSYTMASNQQQHSDASNISTAAEEGGPVLYASMHQLLWRSQVLLFVESSFTMSAVIVHQVNGDLDPLWFLMSSAQAVRSCVYTMFLRDLTDMLKSRARRGGGGAGGDGSGTARRSGRDRRSRDSSPSKPARHLLSVPSGPAAAKNRIKNDKVSSPTVPTR